MKLGVYELEGEIGRGGMGVVYRARSGSGETVAIKLLAKNDRESLARFDRERRLQTQLSETDGFVPLLDAVSSPQGAYLVMPFLPGGTLRARIEKGPLGIEETIALGRTLARALGRAHALGIVHRDFKPENVLFDAAGRPLVADLGLSKHFESEGAGRSVLLSKTGEVRGTAGYMPYEQLADARSVGPRADVFALGAVLYECLAGVAAFGGNAPIEVFGRVDTGRFEPLRRLRPEVPRWVASAIERAIARDARARFADGASFEKALEAPRRSWTPALALLVVAAAAGAALLRSPPPAPVEVVRKAAVVTDPVPEWYRRLAAADKPPLPLPSGLSLGAGTGEYVNDRDGSVLVFVPAGVFPMGRSEKVDGRMNNELPAHEVELSAYFLGKLELTLGQFAAFVGSASHVTTAEAAHASPTWRTLADVLSPTHPVSLVSWDDARAYCKWAGLRLPTEAEWERAASWDAKRRRKLRYAWGDEEPGTSQRRLGNLPDESLHRAVPGTLDWFRGYDDGFAHSAPVGSFPDGASPVGALDMTGNVSEWVEDRYDEQFYLVCTFAPGGRTKDPLCSEEAWTGRIARGGSFFNYRSELWTVARNHFSNGEYYDNVGFRVARAAR
ncbi:MAG TPA: bifunctional serine/threonine-protein kinase/formylglycine-generating enzyme family protein [Planctomycetota bacterium]|nr:bifunctional serine/threonine-protein kinase/formylglycine-generating enzyme family protein [Planctomycetota bacterium]